jgi:hypothetical protein
MTPFVLLLFPLISLLQLGSALQVTPGSTCAAFCLDNPESDPLNPNASNTTPDDITCTDDSYDNSATGIKFKNCLDCLQQSNATRGTESDVSWFLCMTNPSRNSGHYHANYYDRQRPLLGRRLLVWISRRVERGLVPLYHQLGMSTPEGGAGSRQPRCYSGPARILHSRWQFHDYASHQRLH